MNRKTRKYGRISGLREPGGCIANASEQPARIFQGGTFMKKLLLAAFLLTSPAWAQQPPDLGRRLPVDPIPPVMKQIPAEIPMAGVEAGGNPGPLNDLIHSQTAAVNFLNRKIEDLEKRVAALEKRK